MSFLESERLILRPPRHADIQAMAVWLGDFAVSRNLAQVPHPYSEADAEDFVAKRGRHGDGHYCFTITRKQDGVFLGGIGLHLEAAGYEFGYWLGKPFWGLGYASEAARSLVQFAFDRLDAPIGLGGLVSRQSGLRSCPGQAGGPPQWQQNARLRRPGRESAVP